MDEMQILLSVGGVAALLGGLVVWVVCCAWLPKRDATIIERELNRARQLIEEYGALSEAAKDWTGTEILALLEQANERLRWLHGPRRQQFEARMGELHLKAIQIGMSTRNSSQPNVLEYAAH